MDKKIELNKTETSFLFLTKHWLPKDYNGEVYVWEETDERSVLKGRDKIVFYFLKTIGLKQDYLDLRNLNKRLLDLITKIDEKAAKRILEELIKISSSFSSNLFSQSKYNHNQAIFVLLFGELQSTQIKEDNKDGVSVDIFDCDYSDLEEK
jgi:hypothetical protein